MHILLTYIDSHEWLTLTLYLFMRINDLHIKPLRELLTIQKGISSLIHDGKLLNFYWFIVIVTNKCRIDILQELLNE